MISFGNKRFIKSIIGLIIRKTLYLIFFNIWAFGYNRLGQLGINDKVESTLPIPIKEIKARKISSGVNSTAVIDINNNV